MDEKDKELQELRRKVEALRIELHDCRNELCWKCGAYECSYQGACDSCRFRDGGKWETL